MRTDGAQRTTLNAQRSTLNAQRPTLNAQRSTLNAQRSTLNAQRTTLNAQPACERTEHRNFSAGSRSFAAVRPPTRRQPCPTRSRGAATNECILGQISGSSKYGSMPGNGIGILAILPRQLATWTEITSRIFGRCRVAAIDRSRGFQPTEVNRKNRNKSRSDD